MTITGMVITIETDGGLDDEGLEAKKIIMDGNNWTMPAHLFPRDLKFLANIQELIESYNGRRRDR